MKGHVSKDHVHLLVSIPPHLTISRLMQWLKGKTAHNLLLAPEKTVLGPAAPVGEGLLLL